jgi:hypothetical protein
MCAAQRLTPFLDATMLGVAERSLLFLLDARDDGLPFTANRCESSGESNVVSEYKNFTTTRSYHTHDKLNACNGG